MTRLVLCFLVLALAACGPGRTTFASYPGAPAAFDKAGSDPKAIEIAEQVFTAAGGPGNWDKAKQIKWHQTVTADGKVTTDGVEAWDRWNARHYGALARQDGSTLKVGYDLYGSHAIGFMEDAKHRKQNLDDASRGKAVQVAKDVFNMDTAILCLQFMMMSPGATLKYIGPAKDDQNNENYDELKVTFADPVRAGLEFHPIVDRTTHVIQRIEIYKTGNPQKIGYTLKDWTTAGGLKFATNRANMGYSGETIAITDISVGNPEDDLFIAPLN
jgi:hypothetical protein